MTDIQKAIKFVKSEIKSLELASKINGCEMTELWEERIKIWETAISALEKQVPKKPRKTRTEIVCPTCATLVGSSPYCRYCGQKLDWSDTK